MILKASALKGSSSLGLRSHDFFFVAHLVALDAVDVQRGGQVGDHGVEHRLHALVLERSAGQDRGDLRRERGATDTGLDLLDAELFAFEVLLHDGVVVLGKCFQQLLAPFLGLGLQVRGDLLDGVVLTLRRLAAPGQCAASSTRSTTPMKSASLPIGICSTSGTAFSRETIMSTHM